MEAIHGRGVGTDKNGTYEGRKGSSPLAQQHEPRNKRVEHSAGRATKDRAGPSPESDDGRAVVARRGIRTGTTWNGAGPSMRAVFLFRLKLPCDARLFFLW